MTRETVSILGTDPVETYPTTFDYDQDALLTRAGSLQINNDSQTGLPRSTTIGAVTTATAHNSFAEPTSWQVTGPTGGLFSQTYQRNSLGRITTKTETTPQGTDSYNYSYDQAGRLTRVEKNNTVQATYLYHQNGNRTSSTRLGSSLPTTATYKRGQTRFTNLQRQSRRKQRTDPQADRPRRPHHHPPL